jgi:type II secretory pathway pseudopilin PulG
MPADPSSPQTIDPNEVRNHRVIFAIVCVATIIGILGYVAYSRRLTTSGNATHAASIVEESEQLTIFRQQPHLLFRNTALGPAYGRFAVVPLSNPGGVRSITPLSGERVYAAGDGSGFALRASRRAFTTYDAVSFDESFKIRHTFKLAGAPSRTRVSSNGSMAASTVFVSGDSYNTGGFSTRTTVFDLRTGSAVGDLEDFSVQKDGQIFKKADFNFWGVTFTADDDRFYATLGSGDVPYLVEGRISARQAQVVRAGVECPSLSPDGSRLVFKSRLTEGGRRVWQLRVLDLATQTEVALSETRNVDDQAEWLDDTHVIYALPRDSGETGQTDLWKARADGTGTSELLVSDASSPSVIRPR